MGPGAALVTSVIGVGYSEGGFLGMSDPLAALERKE